MRDDAKETTEWREITRWNSSDVFIPVSAAGHAFAFANEGRSVLVLTSANASAIRLVRISAKTGQLEKVLAAGEKGKDEDVVATAFDASSGELAAFGTERLRRKWHTTAKAWDPDADLVHRAFNESDEFSVASKASDNSRVILRFMSDTAPPTYYLLDLRDKKNRTLTKQITVRGAVQERRAGEAEEAFSLKRFSSSSSSFFFERLRRGPREKEEKKNSLSFSPSSFLLLTKSKQQQTNRSYPA